jgi:hypothetical protein
VSSGLAQDGVQLGDMPEKLIITQLQCILEKPVALRKCFMPSPDNQNNFTSEPSPGRDGPAPGPAAGWSRLGLTATAGPCEGFRSLNSPGMKTPPPFTRPLSCGPTMVLSGMAAAASKTHQGSPVNREPKIILVFFPGRLRQCWRNISQSALVWGQFCVRCWLGIDVHMPLKSTSL